MKFKNIFLLLTFFSIFSACESDNNSDVSITETDLIGTWNLVNQSIENGIITYSGNGQNISASFSSFSKNEDLRITFSDNPKQMSAEGNYTIVATVAANGVTQTDETVASGNSDPNNIPNWELNGNNIALSNDMDFPANLIIQSFTGKVLTLRADINQTESSNGETATVKANFYMVLEK